MSVIVTGWSELLQGLAAFIGALGAVLVAIYGKKKAHPYPPVERPPSPHEIRELLESIRQRVERHHEMTQGDLDDIKRALDRIESTSRLQEAVAGLRRGN